MIDWQTEAKTSLKNLLVTEDAVISFLCQNHDEFNRQHFEGKLSVPLITIEKLNNKTLGCYNARKNQLYLKNHIKFNTNFIKLNTEERIIETLLHEMIHQ